MATIPMFDGDSYDFWCVKMKTLFLSMDLWDIVENGYNEPKVKPAMTESQKIQLKKNQQNDAAALSKIQQGVSDSIFPKIMKATKAKEAWDILRQEFQEDAQDQNLNEAKEDQPTQQCHSDHMESELYKAAVEGNLEILRENKDQLNLQLTPNKNTVLHIAALFGQTECVEEILKINSSLLCQPNVKGDTALHLAGREGQQDSVDALIKHANKLDEDSVELESGSTMTKKMLRARNEDGDTALHDTLRLYSHQIKLSIRLLTEDKEYTYTANNAGETPLYIAAERRHHEVVSQILKTSTAPAYDGPGGRTALHAVVISNDEGSTKTLLDWNKDLAKKPDMYGWTPLHYAARFGHVERAKQLLDVDKSIAYVIADKDDKKTALYVAASQGHVGVMKELLSQCPDCWEMVNDKGQNILHVAVQNENKKVVKFILENSQLSSLINHKDIDGNTPLHLTATALCGNELMYDERADRMAFNKRNQTPLDVTTHYENVTSVTQALKKTESKKGGHSLGWRNIISDDNENLTKKMKANAKRKRLKRRDIRKVMKTQLIVAALIATVTFAAGFTMPGGYDGNQGPNQGMATLTREAAFKAFAVTNTIAMILSTSAILIDFWGVLISDRDKLLKYFAFATSLISIAIIAIVLAFITGTYAVLEHSRALAIAVCVTSFLFFWIFYNLFKETLNMAIKRSSL
ncbi:unnamed protein product [Camellia sinensis]